MTFTELPVRSPPVDSLEALSVLQVIRTPSEVRRVMVLAVDAVISPEIVKPVLRSLKFSGISPVIPRIVSPSRVVPLKSAVYITFTCAPDSIPALN